MKKRNMTWALVFGALLTVSLNSCKKDDNDDHGEENELITTIVLDLVNVNDISDKQHAVWYKANPNSIDPPDTSGAILNLLGNSTYHATISVLDETQNPVANITDEIEELSDEHLFFFFPSSGLDLTVAATDQDVNGLPIGLQSNFTSGSTSSGLVRVVLRHQPGVKDGTYAPGDSDIDVNFRVNINP